MQGGLVTGIRQGQTQTRVQDGLVTGMIKQGQTTLGCLTSQQHASVSHRR